MTKLRFSNLRKISSYKQIIAILLFIGVIVSPISLQASPKRIAANVLDGVISEGEYTYSQSIDGGNFILYWQTTEENSIVFAMEVKTTGWISIGLDPTDRMKDADMYIGWVSLNGTVDIIDAYSIGEYGPHPPDTELGGSDNILGFNGSETNQVTIIEFEREINTPDTDYDNPIPVIGEIPVIWAYGITDNYEDQHAGVSRGTIFWNLQGASVLKYDFSQPLILAFAFFLTLTGLLFYVDSKGRPPKIKKDINDGDH